MSITRRGAILGSLASVAMAQKPAAEQLPDVPFVPTPFEVVEAMLKLAKVGAGDAVYDLGCGDGRIVIMAAQKFGATGVGIDLDEDLIRDAQASAKKAGVEKKVRFTKADLFTTDISHASVVTVYLLPKVLERLRPKLLSELKPGTRVVSFSFEIPGWPPDKIEEVTTRHIYYWVVPPRAQ